MLEVEFPQEWKLNINRIETIKVKFTNSIEIYE
jgi:hypothetical protein